MPKQTNIQVRCYDCVHASLLQWCTDPVISNCQLYGRKVAVSMRFCQDFKKRNTVPSIKQYG